MCTGMEPAALAMLYASLASTAAGTYYGVKSKNDVAKAKNRAMADELANKERVNKESQKLFGQTAEASSAGDALEQARAAAAEQVAAKNDAAVAPEVGFGSEGNAMPVQASEQNAPIVKEAAARSLSDALQKADSQIKAKSLLTGLGMQRQQRMRQLDRANQAEGMIKNFMQGWGNVGQFGQAAAANAGQGDAMLGDILTGLGQAGQAYAGTMKGGGGGAGEGGQLVTPGTGLVADSPYAMGGLKLGPQAATFANPGTRF